MAGMETRPTKPRPVALAIVKDASCILTRSCFRQDETMDGGFKCAGRERRRASQPASGKQEGRNGNYKYGGMYGSTRSAVVEISLPRRPHSSH